MTFVGAGSAKITLKMHSATYIIPSNKFNKGHQCVEHCTINYWYYITLFSPKNKLIITDSTDVLTVPQALEYMACGRRYDVA